MSNEPKEPQKLTPEAALGVLDQAVSAHQGTRRDHQLLQASIAMLAEIVKEWRQAKESASQTPTNGITSEAKPEKRPRN